MADAKFSETNDKGMKSDNFKEEISLLRADMFRLLVGIVTTPFVN